MGSCCACHEQREQGEDGEHQGAASASSVWANGDQEQRRDLHQLLPPRGMQRLPAIAESEEEEESDEGNNTELLIETMAREHAAEKMSYCGSQSGKVSCENVFDELDVEEMTESLNNEISIHKDYVVWPSLPHIVPVEEGSMEGGENCSIYTVESPSGSPIHDSTIHEEEAPRRQKQKLEIVGDVAANRMRKRNLEGLLKEEEKAKLQAGVKRLAHAAAALADRSFPRGRPLLGDRDGIQIG